MREKKYAQEKCVAIGLLRYRIQRNKITVVLLFKYNFCTSALKLQGNVISF